MLWLGQPTSVLASAFAQDVGASKAGTGLLPTHVSRFRRFRGRRRHITPWPLNYFHFTIRLAFQGRSIEAALFTMPPQPHATPRSQISEPVTPDDRAHL